MAALGTSQVSMDVWHSQLVANVATVATQLHCLVGIIEDLRGNVADLDIDGESQGDSCSDSDCSSGSTVVYYSIQDRMAIHGAWCASASLFCALDLVEMGSRHIRHMNGLTSVLVRALDLARLQVQMRGLWLIRQKWQSLQMQPCPSSEYGVWGITDAPPPPTGALASTDPVTDAFRVVEQERNPNIIEKVYSKLEAYAASRGPAQGAGN